MDITRLSLTETQEAVQKKECSYAEVTDAYLSRIKEKDGETHAYLEVYADEARAAAKKADQSEKTKSPLFGMPIGLKDILLDQGHVVTSGSKILEGYVSPYSASVVTKLRNAGAVVIGRTNMDEFAMGSTTESSAWGATKNPWDTLRVPGGSSGGSAAAVAADLCIAALGTDTGGSVRQPAALCGMVGLKPTYGRVSRYGVIALASSLDQVGPMTKTVKDAGALLSVIEGRDEKDATSFDASAIMMKERRDLTGLRIGVPKEYLEGIPDQDVEKGIREAINELEQHGAKIVPVSLPHAKYALAVYYILMPAEASSNLSRMDGIRFGKRESASSLKELYEETRGKRFGDETRRRIMLGTFVLSAGYYDAYYRKAQEVRTLVKRDYAEVFETVDVLATPTSPLVAWKLGEKLNDPLAMYVADIDTVSVNVAGLPAISLPCGMAHNLPIGLQLIGPAWSEGTLLSVADCAERIFNFRSQFHPSI